MRKINSLKNFFSVAIPFFIVGILGFIRVRFFLDYLGEDISSLNQLFNNLLAYLALAEGGVGLFVVQKYYKCFVDNDKKRITELFMASKKYFHIISIVILVCALILSFGLNILTNNSLSLGYMQIAFLIFSVRYVIEYWFYPARFVIQADQKIYKVNWFLYLVRIIELILEIILLKFVPNYLIILIPGLIVRIIGYPLINRYIYKLYPFLNEKIPYKKGLLKGFSNIVSQKVSGLIYENTDVLIASSFLTPASVIMYTSYNYISKYINDFTYLISSSAMSSLGNSLYKETREDNYIIFNKFNVMFSFFTTFFVICFIILINPFINLWVGDNYSSTFLTVYLFAIVLYLNIIKKPITLVKDNLGLFKETKYIIFIEAILNVGISILLVNVLGINGILLGTIISSFVTTLWYIPYYIYKNFFKEKMFRYFYPLLISLFLITFSLFITTKIFFNINSFVMWFMWAIIIAIIVLIVSFGVFYLLFPSFRTLLSDIKNMNLFKKNK